MALVKPGYNSLAQYKKNRKHSQGTASALLSGT
jgi:hypothetical protein